MTDVENVESVNSERAENTVAMRSSRSCSRESTLGSSAIFRKLSLPTSNNATRLPKSPVDEISAAGVDLWHSIVRGASSGRASLIPRLITWRFPDTFIFDPKQGMTGLIYRDRGVEILQDVAPESILNHLNPSGSNGNSTVAVLKRASGPGNDGSTPLDLATLIQVIKRIHESDETSVTCIQAFISGTKPPQKVRVTYSSLRTSFLAHTITDPRVRLCGSGIDQDLRQTVKSVHSFVENFFRVHLSQIIVDCIRTTHSSPWVVLQVYSLALDRVASTINCIKKLSTFFSAQCGICRDCEVCKFVTVRMIAECHRSISTRLGSEVFEPFLSRMDTIGSVASKGGTVKCCDECYSMIMNEFELIKVGKKISKILSPSSPETSSSFWRMFVYVDELVYPPDDVTPSPTVSFTCLDNNLKFNIGGGTRKYFIHDVPDMLGFESHTVFVNLDDTYTGSVECVPNLIARARITPGQDVIHCGKIFFGVGKFALVLYIGLCWYASPTCAKYVPLPDQWVAIISKGRPFRRSASNSRRFCVRS